MDLASQAIFSLESDISAISISYIYIILEEGFINRAEEYAPFAIFVAHTMLMQRRAAFQSLILPSMIKKKLVATLLRDQLLIGVLTEISHCHYI